MTEAAVKIPIERTKAREKPSAGKGPNPPTLPLLLEVGCEEIPARFLSDAEKDLGRKILDRLSRFQLLPRGIQPGGQGTPRNPRPTFSTPRRLTVYVPEILAKQRDAYDEIAGPPVKVALDAGGKYTRAAESFAAKNSASLEDLIRTTTPKGEYLVLRRTVPGRPALELLPDILKGAIVELGLSFPKGMHWSEGSKARFVRPVRWIVAILGEGKYGATVEFDVLGVRSGNFTFGHQVKGSGSLAVTGFKSYSKKLFQSFVEIDPVKRLERVIKESQALAENAGLKIFPDEWLANWIVNSTEWPRPMLGTFDKRFLGLPREILITVMRDHQKYFAVEDQQGSLSPHFVAVLNMDSDEKGLICQGHERVLTARFRDAEFFWDTDLKVLLERRMDILERVTYQAELGSYGDKVRRMRAIASGLCENLEFQGKFRQVETSCVMQAIDLCKCDLTTQMVQEFPELQGIVGGLYAKKQSLSKDVYEAIYDHYLPQGAEDRCPRSLIGAVVSLADKLDSVVAGFAVGHEPSSSGDPYALRRLGNGIIKVLLEFKLPIDLSGLVQEYHEKIAQGGWFGIQNSVPWARVLMEVPQFFNDRLRFYLESVRGLRYDNVRAVIAAAPKLAGVPVIAPLDILQRAEALEALRGSEDLEALCAAAKRIRNILLKSASGADWTPGEVAPELLTEPQEKELYDAYLHVAAESGRLGKEHEYRRALETISTVRPTVDRFFDKVLVMAENRAIRQNRLRLLKKLDELFSGIAHFAEIEGQ